MTEHRYSVSGEDTLVNVSNNEKLHRVTIHMPSHDVIAGIKLLEKEIVDGKLTIRLNERMGKSEQVMLRVGKGSTQSFDIKPFGIVEKQF